jgi:uncharacterized protein (TIGR03067 family)
MRRRILLLAAAVVLVAADNRKEDSATQERDKLQGYWDVIAMERDGARTPARDLKEFKFIFTGNKLTVSRGNKQRYDATYKLDLTGTPKAIDITFLMGPDEGKTFRGIYTLDGNTLKLCWSAGGQKRPTELTTKPKSARTLFVLKRGKA